jgi:hypothetical protein
LLENNKYCKELKFIGDYIEENERKDPIVVIAQLSNEVEYFDVAAISNIAQSNLSKTITIMTKQHGQTSLNMSSPIVEPLSYPLLFLKGEDGWGEDDKETISFRNYLCNKMLMPEKVIKYDGPDDHIGNHQIFSIIYFLYNFF